MYISSVSNLNNKINFCYNGSSQPSSESKIGKLIHYTCMFREPKTDSFVLKHIQNNLNSNDSINIVSAACSSGEEPMSYLIMLDNLLDKLQISAFDLDDESVTNARSGKVMISADAAEAFLLDSSKIKTDFQRLCYCKFKKYFKPTGRSIAPDDSTLSRLLKRVNPKKYLAGFKYEFEIDPEIFKHISFLKGDVRKIQKIYKQDSIDILLCRNTLYHVLCERVFQDNRSEQKDAFLTANNIAKQMNSIMKMGGLVVFGQKEKDQGVRPELISEAMYNNGFRPVFVDNPYAEIFFENNIGTEQNTSIPYSNVWEKVENVI